MNVAESERSELGIAVIENVLARRDFQYVNVGDLFLSPDAISYIPYGAFRSSSPIATGAAAALGGVVGLAAEKLLDGAISDATPAVNKSRISDWGVPLAERIERHVGSLTIRRGQILAIETEGGLSIKAEDHLYMFASTPSQGAQWIRDRLKGEYGLDSSAPVDVSSTFLAWFNGTSLPDHLFRNAGFGIPYPAPSHLVDAFRRGDVAAVRRELLRASDDDAYMTRFFALFQMLDRKTSRALLLLLREMPDSVRRHVVAYLARRSTGAEKPPTKPIMAIVGSLLGSAAAAIDLESFFTFLVFVGTALVVFIASIMIYSWFEQRAFARLLASFKRSN